MFEMGENRYGIWAMNSDEERRVEIQRVLNYGDSPPLSVLETAHRLGISPDGVLSRIKQCTIVDLPIENDTRIPAWQFHKDRPQILPDVIFLMKVVPEDPWGIAGILTKSQPLLDGAVPVEIFRGEDLEAKLKARRTINALIKDVYGLD